ncbi:MAG TPA: O-antigen ligase family protein [Blastocatellia bacterium]|nr:O-antigen ligase family protein [Blastocatellia bacterium]
MTKTSLSVRLKAHSALFFVCTGLVLFIPLVFSTAVHRTSALPKFALLICGASVVLSLFGLAAASRQVDLSRAISAWPFRMMSLFVFVIALSTVFGDAPVASLFGGYLNQTGFLTHVCFFIVYVGLVSSVPGCGSRLIWLLWAIALAGLLAGIYATAQFFGRDPFLSSASYTFNSSGTRLVRPPGTLGHPDALGNFLLYTWPAGLALARLSTGSARRIALAACGFSIIAIVLSGTRGAWLGAAAAVLSFAYLELRNRSGRRLNPRQIGIGLVTAVVLLALVGAIGPVRRAVFNRARAVITEGITGSGRTYLWHDALKMLPRYAIVGCGPDAFSRAFPPYRSEKLARYSAGIANESSHDMYLDTAISYGLPGAMLYVAIIAASLYRLFKPPARASDPTRGIVIAGVAPAIIGAAVHNLFMYDQIATGLYFYTFMALALIASGEIDPVARVAPANPVKGSDARLQRVGWWLAAVAGLTVVVASVWYAFSILRCDRAVRDAYIAAGKNDIEALEHHCRVAATSPDPTRAYGFAAAQAVLAYVATQPGLRNSIPGGNSGTPVQLRVIAMGRSLAEDSLPRSLSPSDNCVLIAYFALLGGDTANCARYAEEAVRLDPFNPSARSLVAEALFAEGDLEDAIREAKAVLDINPGFDRAESILIRARPESERLPLAARALERGNTRKAERILKRVVRLYRGRCIECRRALALFYEQTGRTDEAIVEWKLFEAAAPDQARALGVTARIASLSKGRK